MKTRIILFLVLLLTSFIAAQTDVRMNELKIIGKAELSNGDLIARENRDANGAVCAGLRILSDLDGLKFDSYDKIVKVTSDPGSSLLFLSPGEQVVIVYMTGFAPLKIILADVGVHLKSGMVWQLKLTGTRAGSLSRADDNLFDVVFQLNQDAVYSWYGELAPMPSKGQTAAYKLPKGYYTFHFQKDGYKPEERTINIDKSITETVSLSPDASSASLLKLPGIAVITSEPSGAEIILNGQKLSSSPFQGELQPGNYELELRKVFYQSDISSFSVEQGNTITISRKLNPKFGFISVSSSVADSKVTLDGKFIGNVPVEKYQVESSAHTVVAEAPLYHSVTEGFIIKDGEQKNINAVLKPAFGLLKITSQPENGVDIYIDGVKTGQTPYINNKTASGRYLLRVTKELYRDYEEQIIITDGAETIKNIILDKNFGELTIISEGSEIVLNGRVIGKDKVLQKLNAGKYTISSVRGDKYYEAKQDVYLSIGERKEITLTPKPKIGGLSLFVEPAEAAGADIYIDNEPKGKAPLVMSLLVGDYTVTAKKDNFLDETQRFSIPENERIKLTLTMFTYEGSRLHTANKWATAKWISLAGTAAFGGASYYFNTSADKNNDKYKTTMINSDALDYKKNVNDNKKMSGYFLYAASAALSSALISWIVQTAL